MCWYEALYKNGALTFEFTCSLDLTTYCVHWRDGQVTTFKFLLVSVATLFLNAADTKTWAALKFDQLSDQQLAIYRENGTGIWTHWNDATAYPGLGDLRGSNTSNWVGAHNLARVFDSCGSTMMDFTVAEGRCGMRYSQTGPRGPASSRWSLCACSLSFSLCTELNEVPLSFNMYSASLGPRAVACRPC
jgi:hypothetical protein